MLISRCLTFVQRCNALAVLLALGLALASRVQAEPVVPTLNLEYHQFELDNGLRVVVHEDRKAPIVAVNVWYHVGSKNETPGKTGFAHLFEHLMFNGSEHHDDEYFAPFERIGATDMNGTTNNDRTNYFQNVPTSGLDLALWMESDRMGHLLGAVTQEKLDEQRGVVQNEKRQGENQPYGRVFQTLARYSFPPGHPYSWPVIGSMEDLEAASLEDVHTWFKTYYGPSNATLVLAGDIDLETARQKAEHYFGDIPGGEPLEQGRQWVAPMEAPRRVVIEDRVPQPRVYLAWNLPPITDSSAPDFELMAQLLGGGRNAQLYRRLVYKAQIATSVSAFYYGRELAGQMIIVADVRPGANAGDVEAAIQEELSRFKDKGPSKAALSRAKTAYMAEMVRHTERVGGFGGKSDLLARGAVFFDDPGAFAPWLERIAAVERGDLKRLARTWLGTNRLAIVVTPFPNLTHASTGADRSQLPAPGEPPELELPSAQTATLSNGLEVVLVERRQTPLVQFSLQFDAGYAADVETVPGTQSFALAMLKEGTSDLDAFEISEREEALGAQISTGSTLDTTTVALSTLTTQLEPALQLFTEVVTDPAFPADEIERKRGQWLAGIAQEQAQPVSLALRTLPPLLYGAGHPYATPMTGSGTEAGVRALDQATLRRFHQRWFNPQGATLIVVGDVGLDGLLPVLEQTLGAWEPQTPTARVGAPNPVQPPTEPRLYLLDKPGAEQTTLFVGTLLPPTGAPNDIALQLLNQVFGGTFTSRLNMNLREDKHWSYGARSLIRSARGQRPFLAYSAVQADQTVPAMHEILAELNAIRGQRPPTAAELEKVVLNETLKRPGRFETNAALAAELAEAIRFDRGLDYIETYADAVRNTNLDELQAASTLIDPRRLVWVIVGDLAAIEADIRALEWGEVEVLDATAP